MTPRTTALAFLALALPIAAPAQTRSAAGYMAAIEGKQATPGPNDDIYLPAVSPHANYDVSPDGTKLLMLQGIDSPRVIVVENWATEVRRLLADAPSRR